VNTVQQSLLENTLCLIGFSGHDPNFLQWIGWINDNIGKDNAPKIYLIGVLNLTDAQVKLLNSKNIITVDLGVHIGDKKKHKEGLGFFLNYLESQKDQKESLLWPEDKYLHGISFNKEKNTTEDLIKGWERLRESYPNWVILPYGKREKLWRYTERHAGNIKVFDELTPISDLNYIYELNWRLERCMFPIWNHMAPYFQKVLDQYNLFPNKITVSPPIDLTYLEDNKIDRKTLRTKWVDVALSLLRLYREEKYEENWHNLEKYLSKILEYLSPDQVAQFYYEKILFYIFQFDHPTALKSLNEWQVADSSPFWETKRANLMMEFGFNKEARKILENTLNTIRKRLNLSSVNNDYTWLSQEAYVMFLLRTTRSNFDDTDTPSLFNNFN